MDLKTFSFASVLLRLFLAMIFGGMIGLERGWNNKAAGFRTYMLVCVGAATTMLIGQYQFYMLETTWSAVLQMGAKTDVTRASAQVINGIGFLGAGTILVTGNQKVKGVTTAAALWASACMGIVIGAGFYECVLIGFAMIVLCTKFLNPVETWFMQRSQNLNLYVEFESLQDLPEMIQFLKGQEIHIYDIEIQHGNSEYAEYPSAVLTLRQNKRYSHNRLIGELFSCARIRRIDEI